MRDGSKLKTWAKAARRAGTQKSRWAKQHVRRALRDGLHTTAAESVARASYWDGYTDAMTMVLEELEDR